jgi:ABC-type glycerol-3-phosphate transport system substrate-binding protein
MPRRHAWMQDYNYEVGHLGDRSIPTDYKEDKPVQQQPPVNINININLGDLISQLVSGKKTTKEALEEIVKSKESKKEQLNG